MVGAGAVSVGWRYMGLLWIKIRGGGIVRCGACD
jgi:hypothetical protein